VWACSGSVGRGLCTFTRESGFEGFWFRCVDGVPGRGGKRAWEPGVGTGAWEPGVVETGRRGATGRRRCLTFTRESCEVAARCLPLLFPHGPRRGVWPGGARVGVFTTNGRLPALLPECSQTAVPLVVAPPRAIPTCLQPVSASTGNIRYAAPPPGASRGVPPCPSWSSIAAAGNSVSSAWLQGCFTGVPQNPSARLMADLPVSVLEKRRSNAWFKNRSGTRSSLVWIQFPAVLPVHPPCSSVWSCSKPSRLPGQTPPAT
jgi:hypothetical protein